MKCCALSDEEKNKNKVKLTVTYDIGWQNILSGRRYETPSGHDFVISGISKGNIGMVLYSKACPKCDTVDTRGEESE